MSVASVAPLSVQDQRRGNPAAATRAKSVSIIIELDVALDSRELNHNSLSFVLAHSLTHSLACSFAHSLVCSLVNFATTPGEQSFRPWLNEQFPLARNFDRENFTVLTGASSTRVLVSLISWRWNDGVINVENLLFQDCNVFISVLSRRNKW